MGIPRIRAMEIALLNKAITIPCHVHIQAFARKKCKTTRHSETQSEKSIYYTLLVADYIKQTACLASGTQPLLSVQVPSYRSPHSHFWMLISSRKGACLLVRVCMSTRQKCLRDDLLYKSFLTNRTMTRASMGIREDCR